MENNTNISEKTKNEIIFNFIKNINDINTKSLEIRNNQNINDVDKNLLKEKDKKIQDLQKQCEELKKQLEIKTDFKNKDKKEQNNILKNEIYNNNYFNTSTNFPNKIEIKKVWEELAMVSILDTFIDYESEPEIIFHLVCEMILIMDKLINDLCLEIYEKVSISLNIPVHDKKFICDIEKVSRPLIKENLNKIFIDTENMPFINKFKYLYQNTLKNNNIFNYCKNDKDKITQIIDGEEFIQMIKKIKDILLYTKFNDQQLFFKIEPDIKKRNIEKIFIKNNNDKKKYLIINDNNLNNISGVVILNPPVMKNGFQLNNDFKSIIMLLNENRHINFNKNDLNTFLNENKYEIYTNSFTIYDKNMKMINRKNDSKTFSINSLRIYKDNNISLPVTKIVDNNDSKSKDKLKLKIKTSIPAINQNDLEIGKSKRSHRDQNINYSNNNFLLNTNIRNSIQNKNNNKQNYINNISNINTTFIKQHKSFLGQNYLKANMNKNSFSNLIHQTQEIFYDSLLQSEYTNSPKYSSENSSISGQEQLISINNDEIKNLQEININNGDIDNNILYNNYDSIKKNILNKKRYSRKDKENTNDKNISNSRRSINKMNKKNVRKIINNHGNKNIYKSNNINDSAKYGKQNIMKDICSTEINSYNSYINNYLRDSGCLKKYRTVKEITNGKNNISEEKYIFPLSNEQNYSSSQNKNLYQKNGNKYLNNKKDINLFKEHLKIKKTKLRIDNNSTYNYNNHKFKKNSSYKNKINNKKNFIISNINNNDYKNNHFQIQKILHYSPLNSNMTFISTKNCDNNKDKNKNKKNNLNRQTKERDHYYNNKNLIRNKINTKNNNSFNTNNISENRTQPQISSSSSIMKDNSINTGFKIKNVNINYFNIMQTNELFFNHNKKSSSKSRSSITNKNNSNFINAFKYFKKNNNLKSNFSNSNLNKNDNSLCKLTEKIKKDKKRIVLKFNRVQKHNDSCLSNDIKRTKINSNEQKKMRILKQLHRLYNKGNNMNSFDRINKNKNISKNFNKKKKEIENIFYIVNNKDITFLNLSNKTRNNSIKNKDRKSREKTLDKLKMNNMNINENYGYNSKNRRTDDYDSQNIFTQNYSKSSNNTLLNGSNTNYLPNNKKY